MTTIAVPKQADYEDAGKLFEQMAFGLLTAADLTRNLDFRPGTFREAQDLQQAVDCFCQDRQDTLEIYSEACVYIGEIIRLCGETYTGSEQQRVEKGSDLDSRIGSALKGLQRLHGELDKIRQRGSTRLPKQRDPEPRYHIMTGNGPGPSLDNLTGVHSTSLATSRLQTTSPTTTPTTTTPTTTTPTTTTPSSTTTTTTTPTRQTPAPAPAATPAPSSQASTGGSKKA